MNSFVIRSVLRDRCLASEGQYACKGVRGTKQKCCSDHVCEVLVTAGPQRLETA